MTTRRRRKERSGLEKQDARTDREQGLGRGWPAERGWGCDGRKRRSPGRAGRAVIGRTEA